MTERLSDKVKEYISTAHGRISLKDLRSFLQIETGSKDDQNLRKFMATTAIKQRLVSPFGRNDGWYKVITKVQRVNVFGIERQRRLPYELHFPKDFTAEMEMLFADAIVVREGDLITIGGVKSTGKTNLCLSFCAENIDSGPVLMGNEYTISAEGVYEPAPRFLSRLDRMAEWVIWVNGDGMDKFVLLPVREDYAEHVIPDKINIIDWLNIDADALYDIGRVLEGIKANIGRGIAIVALQKGEGASNPRGGQFVRDFSDLEILLDPFGKNPHDVKLTIKGAKEATKPIVGKTFAYTIGEAGTKIFNFREVVRCKGCSGTSKYKGYDCDQCFGTGMVNR